MDRIKENVIFGQAIEMHAYCDYYEINIGHRIAHFIRFHVRRHWKDLSATLRLVQFVKFLERANECMGTLWVCSRMGYHIIAH